MSMLQSVLGTALVCRVPALRDGHEWLAEISSCGSGFHSSLCVLTKQAPLPVFLRRNWGDILQGVPLNATLGWPKNVDLSNYCNLRDKVFF